MKNFAEIDKNFKVETAIKRDGLIFTNVLEAPFKVYGLMYEGGMFRRMPDETAERVSDRVHFLHKDAAGGRVRFRTDSMNVAISVKSSAPRPFVHFTIAGSSGFDLYADNEYVNTFLPSADMTEGYESKREFADKKMRDITINFPLYSQVSELYIGLDEDCVVEEAAPYVNEKPVVFYGSSITQGGCASRPGRCYEAILSRRFNLDYINLGFSGNAKAEDAMSDYIKGLSMSLFVYDYDFNAPDVDHLRATHEKMFKKIREAQPELPIIIMSKPRAILDERDRERRAVIETTYQNALAAGDQNVYFLDGPTLMKYCGNEGTVDRTHPTDFGFASMAQVLGDLIEEKGLI